MRFLRSLRSRPGITFLLLAVFTCAPIWSVRYFINQDGSGHVHGAWILIALLRGFPRFTDLYSFNLIFFPNSIAHWLLSFLLLIFSPFTATKIILTLTYLGLVSAVVWLRWCTVGREGLTTSILLGGALGFNSLWLVGFYSFNLGLIAAIFAVGFFHRWREKMDWKRAAALASFLLLVFFSHIVSFTLLAGSIVVLCLWPEGARSRRNLFWTAASFVPVAPLAAIYRASTEAGGGFSPVWRNLQDNFSVGDLVAQLRGVDSFIIISRRTFPFLDAESGLFAVFAPIMWIAAAFLCLALATWFQRRRGQRAWPAALWPFVLLAAGSVLVSIFSPDHFQFSTSTGGLLRERVFLFGLIMFVPLFRFDGGRAATLKIVAGAALVFVIVFQTAALWEYALRSDRDAREFLTAAPAVPEGSSLATIAVVPDGLRFSANHVTTVGNYIGIGRDIIVWDNYELGHYLFPIVARNREDQKFVLSYTANGGYILNDPTSYSEKRRNELAAVLESGHHRVDRLIVWGSDPNVEAAFRPWFEPEPYFVNGRVRVFRHK